MYLCIDMYVCNKILFSSRSQIVLQLPTRRGEARWLTPNEEYLLVTHPERGVPLGDSPRTRSTSWWLTPNAEYLLVTHPERGVPLGPPLLLLIEKYFGFWSWRFLRSEDHSRLLPDVFVQQLGVAGNWQLPVHTVMIPKATPIWNRKVQDNGNILQPYMLKVKVRPRIGHEDPEGK